MSRNPRILVLTTALVVGAALAIHPMTVLAANRTTAPSPMTAQEPTDPAGTNEAAALARARRTGARVEVLAARGEKSSLFANPDGTLTLESSILPTRVRRGDQWLPIDTSLRWQADGTITSAATSFGLRFSGGGRTPLVTLTDADRELSLTWPTVLPVPTVSGDSATYPNVFKDVDLVLRATRTGVAEVFVVKTAAAAANPALARIRFPVTTRGVTLRSQPQGGFAGVDRSGASVFTGALPLMWDSSADLGQQGARGHGPAPGSHTGRVATTVTADAVTIEPALSSFVGPNTTFPLYVDPSISVGKLVWAEVWKVYPNSTDINPTHDAMVGYENDPCCLPADTVRAFWRMDNTPVNGKHVLSATFRISEHWAWSCSARVVELWWTGSITSNTTWNNQAWIAKQAAVNTAKRNGDANCPAGNVEFDLTSLMQTAANQAWPDATVGLKAASETDPYGWKRFDSNPVIVINYNSVPSVPTSLTIDNKPCGSTTYLGTLTPTMRAQVTDPDPGSLLNVSMYWAATGGAVNDTDKVVQNAVATGSTAIKAIPAGKLLDGQSYFWQTRTSDGIDTSPWSATCSFNVDVTRPALPAVSSSAYPADGNFHGGVGRTGSFSFSANGSADVVAYQYGFADPPTTEVAATVTGGGATVTLTPSAQGINTLYVRSKDRAGNLSDLRTHVFLVGGPTGPVALWLDAPGTGTVVPDDSGNGHSATIAGTTSRVAGRDGAANGGLSLDGVTGYAATSGPVAPANGSFAVAAWVKLTSAANWSSVLCQEGTTNANMLLQYDKATNRWAMAHQTTDTTATTTVRAESPAPPSVGVWTHLAGTYDAGPGTLRLYVNGVLAGTVSTRITWNANGRFLIGTEKLAGTLQHYFAGTLADVRVWDRVVYPAEIAAIASANTPVGMWSLDFDGSDSSGYDHPLTATGGATFFTSTGYNGLGAASLDGTGVLSTSTPVVLTDQSFSVAAWVLLTDSTNVHRTAVCQQGSRTCSFFLQYNGNNKWAFSVRQSDVDNAPGAIALSSTMTTTGVWTHLVGVYDVSAGKARLYVNGQLASEAPVSATTFNAGGVLSVGQAKWNGAAADSWIGDIDEVRVYLGVLSAADVADLYNQ